MRKAVLALAITVAVILGVTQPAQARYNPTQLSHRVVGAYAVNHKNHVTVSIIGTYKYYRKIHRNGAWRKTSFRGLRISAQRCKFGKNPHCWGAVHHAKLHNVHQPGRPMRTTKTAARGIDIPHACYFGALGAFAGQCLSPWNWTHEDQNPVSTWVYSHYTRPCVNGQFAGMMETLAAGAGAQLMLRSGVIAGSTPAAELLGLASKDPRVFGAIMVGACLNGVAKDGIGLKGLP